MMEQETIVRIETSMGNIRVKLYNDTPQHRENFIKLVNNGAYEQVLFHRVIRNFMIQAGDPASKPANMRSTTDARQYTTPFLQRLYIPNISIREERWLQHVWEMKQIQKKPQIQPNFISSQGKSMMRNN